MKKLKSEIAKKIIESGLVKPFDVIEHSFTDGGGRKLERLVISTNGIFPTLTTRPDVLGVVIEYEKNKKE